MTTANPHSNSVSKPRSKRGRPRRDPASAEARQKLIRAGLIHLTERGYSSVGIDDILKSSGVPKGGFYHYFANKEDFGQQLIDAYNAYFLEKLEAAFGQSGVSPLAQLKAFTEDAIAGMARHAYRRGCLIGNLGQEMGALPEAFRAKLVEVLEEWQARTEDCFNRAQAVGEITGSVSSKELAATFWIGWEGAVLRAKLERSAAPLTTFTNVFFAQLKS